MSQQQHSSRMAVLLFTDMVDSVALEGRLGTAAYSNLLQQHHQLFLQVLERIPGGQIRNDSGDGILSEFETAAGAVNAALLFQLLLRETQWEKEAPRVRIGIHQGQLAEIRLEPTSPGKLVGLPVSIASRVMNLAQGGQILMTRPVHDDARQFVRAHPVASTRTAAPPTVRWEAHGAYRFKGGEQPIEIFEVGAAGFAPFTPPPDTGKIHRSVVSPPAAVANWSPAVGAVLASLCGLVLGWTDLGERWGNASYDYGFRFGSRLVTNQVVLVQMDQAAYDDPELGQVRGKPWDRALHARFLNKLAAEDSSWVVFDVLFDDTGEPSASADLVAAMQRHGRVVLMAGLHGAEHEGLDSMTPTLPREEFLHAARTNWGYGWLSPDRDRIVRRHWPPELPGPDSLAWKTARLAGADLSQVTNDRWLRYYGEQGAWTTLSYRFALDKPNDYFRGKIVFIGNKPETPLPDDGEADEFSTPYTRWTTKSVGGVEIQIAEFLNLLNGEWLRRPAKWLEAFALVVTGVLLGGGLCLVRSGWAWLLAAGAALAATLAGVCLSYYTNYWFPWLVIAGGQAPFALAWALGTARIRREMSDRRVPVETPPPPATRVVSNLPEAPDYQLFDPPFGEGGFGKVWLVRNAIGQWQALKAVYQSKFANQTGPYQTEFKGIERYKPVSEKHPGLLRIDFVSRMKPEGYFYYVMELGDGQTADWQQAPQTYKPWNLEFLRTVSNGGRVPAEDCIRIGLALAEALDFLHREGLTHRDIKPSNVIFVNGHPKLADIGLVTEIRSPSQIHTWAGTEGFMPPDPREPPGTVPADIYALGMLLYVSSTGGKPKDFPVLPTALAPTATQAGFQRLNAIIVKACHPDLARRYATAAELHAALQEAHAEFTGQAPRG